MPKRAWGPIALPAIGIAALGVVAWGAIYQPQCHKVLKTLSQQSAEAPKTAYEGSVTCERDCQVTFGLAPNPKNESGDGTAKQNHTCDTPEELDLVQQTVMAHWAFVSALLAMLGLFGVLYTFRETHKLGKLQSRAYLSITKTKVIVFRDGQKFEAKIEVRNTGQTPARDVRVRCTTALIPIPTNRNLLREAKRPPLTNARFNIGADCPIAVRSSHDQPLTVQLIGDIVAGRAAFVVIVKTDYADVFGDPQSEDFQLICHNENAIEGGALAGYSDDQIRQQQP